MGTEGRIPLGWAHSFTIRYTGYETRIRIVPNWNGIIIIYVQTEIASNLGGARNYETMGRYGWILFSSVV